MLCFWNCSYEFANYGFESFRRFSRSCKPIRFNINLTSLRTFFPPRIRSRSSHDGRFTVWYALQTNCNGDKPSYGKKKRASESWSTQATYHAETTPTSKDGTPDELSLELSIIVQNSVASSADRLSSRENSSPDTVLIAGGSEFRKLL